MNCITIDLTGFLIVNFTPVTIQKFLQGEFQYILKMQDNKVSCRQTHFNVAARSNAL